MSQTPEYVVFDLKASAGPAEADAREIIQIGAVRAQGGTELDHFDTYVQPVRELSPRIANLTGIAERDLESAPSVAEALQGFFDWVGLRPLIAHGGFAFQFKVLDEAARAASLPVPSGPRLDTLELAHLIYPRAGAGRSISGSLPPNSLNLFPLATWLGIGAQRVQSALQGARISQKLHRELLERLAVEVPIRHLQRWLLHRAQHPWSRFCGSVDEPVSLEDVVPIPAPNQRSAPTGRYSPEDTVRRFEQGGALMTPPREPRQSQIAMARQVSGALSQPGSRLLIEAPAGTGKTLAYLVPAISHARATGQVAVVASFTRVLQDQIREELESLQPLIGPFSGVILKGKANYISLLQLEAEIDRIANTQVILDGSRAMAVAIIAGWTAETPSGDWSDLRTQAVEEHLSDLRRFRRGLRMRGRLKPPSSPVDRRDFYRRIRNAVTSADLVVVNHALLLSSLELAEDPFDLIVDEAHRLEDAATSAGTIEIKGQRLIQHFDFLWNERRGTGLVADLLAFADPSVRDSELQRAHEAFRRIRTTEAVFSGTLARFLFECTEETSANIRRHGVEYPIESLARTDSARYSRLQNEARLLCGALLEGANILVNLDIPDVSVTDLTLLDLLDERASSALELTTNSRFIDTILGLGGVPIPSEIDDDEIDVGDASVPWLNIAGIEPVRERDTRSTITARTSPQAGYVWALRRVPISVENILQRTWAECRSVILTSATMGS